MITVIFFTFFDFLLTLPINLKFSREIEEIWKSFFCGLERPSLNIVWEKNELFYGVLEKFLKRILNYEGSIPNGIFSNGINYNSECIVIKDERSCGFKSYEIYPGVRPVPFLYFLQHLNFLLVITVTSLKPFPILLSKRTLKLR